MRFVLPFAALIVSVLISACTPTTSQAPIASAPAQASAVHVAMFDGQVTVSTADGSHTYSKAEICRYGYVYVAGGAPRLTLGRSGPFLTVAGHTTNIACGSVGGTGGSTGGGTTPSNDFEFDDSPTVDQPDPVGDGDNAPPAAGDGAPAPAGA